MMLLTVYVFISGVVSSVAHDENHRHMLGKSLAWDVFFVAVTLPIFLAHCGYNYVTQILLKESKK